MAAAGLALALLAATACLPSSGGDCPYTSDQEVERLMYDWGNGKGLDLRKEVEPLKEHFVVGDNDNYDHRFGYRDGYFHGVVNAKFGKPNRPRIDYPDVEAYVRGYLAGLEDGYAAATQPVTTRLSKNETLAFAEGFGDGLLDGKDRCD